MALTGSLEDFSFAEIVQIINQGRKTGELRVHRMREEAQVHFTNGEVTQAKLEGLCHTEPVEGAEVIYRLLGWREGDFEFNKNSRLLYGAIQETTDELILEGMKRLDEWEKVEEEMNDLNVVLRLKAGKVGDNFENLSCEALSLLRLVDARRDVANIIRESGLGTAQALLIITELIGQDLVEKWEAPRQVTLVGRVGRGGIKMEDGADSRRGSGSR